MVGPKIPNIKFVQIHSQRDFMFVLKWKIREGERERDYVQNESFHVSLRVKELPHSWPTKHVIIVDAGSTSNTSNNTLTPPVFINNFFCFP